MVNAVVGGRVRSVWWNLREYARYLAWPWMLASGLAIAAEVLTGRSIAEPFVLWTVPVLSAAVVFGALRSWVTVTCDGLVVSDFGVKKTLLWKDIKEVSFTGRHLGEDLILVVTYADGTGGVRVAKVRCIPTSLWPRVAEQVKQKAPKYIAVMIDPFS